jgi:hypothetical protein
MWKNAEMMQMKIAASLGGALKKYQQRDKISGA